MTAIGLMIIISQFAPSLGYNVKEDTQFVQQFETLAEQAVMKTILDEKAKKEGVLTLEDYQETVNQSKLISSDMVYKEAQEFGKKASGVLGSLKTLLECFKRFAG